MPDDAPMKHRGRSTGDEAQDDGAQDDGAQDEQMDRDRSRTEETLSAEWEPELLVACWPHFLPFSPR